MPHRWRKSSYSGGNGGACIELAYVGAVRDSKNPAGTVLVFNHTGLTEFLSAAKSDRFTR